MWDILGWAGIVAGVLIVVPTSAKVIAGRKSSRMAASSVRSEQWTAIFAGLVYFSGGLVLVAHMPWARAAYVGVGVASGLMWLTFRVRARLRKAR
jgi:hypothetical protein